MNLIPLIATLLIIFALYSSSLSRDLRSTSLSSTSYQNSLAASRSLDNHLANKEFELEKKTLEKPVSADNPQSEKKERAKRSYSPPREKEEIVYNHWSKLNITPLFLEKGKEKHPFLYEAALRLLYDLYSHAFSKQELSALLDALLASSFDPDSISAVLPVTTLLPQENPLFPTLLKLAYGTNSYNLGEKKGYPPFTHFFRWDEVKPKSLYFHHLSAPVIKALFQEKTAGQIAESEKEKWLEEKKHGLTKAELSELLLNKRSRFPMKALEDYLNFTQKKRLETSTGIIDKKSKIRVEKTIHFSQEHAEEDL